LLGLVGLLVWGLMTPLPFHGRLASALGDMTHAPVFALLALGCYLAVRRLGIARWSAGLLVWLLVAAFGLATEVAQSFVGRGDSWMDLLNDALGGAAGVLIGMALEASSRARRTWGIVAGLAIISAAEIDAVTAVWDCIVQRRDMPLLASFEGWRELDRWWSGEAEMKRVESHATDGRHALKVDLFPGVYPGVVLVEPPRDWSGYKTLAFDVEVEPDPSGDTRAAPLELIVKIEDLAHNGEYHDRFHRLLKLHPGRHEIRIPLAQIAAAPRGRAMDMQQIKMLQLFSIGLPRQRTFYLDHIRLE